MVDLGGGTRGQYFAENCLRDSASTHAIRPFLASVTSHLRLEQSTLHLAASPHSRLEGRFTRGEISLHASNRETFSPVCLAHVLGRY